VECPRSSQSGFSHSPNGSAEEGNPAVRRNVCSNRSGGSVLKSFRLASAAALNAPVRSRTSFMGNGMACGTITSWFTALDDAAELA